MAKIEQILEKYGSDPAEIQEILLDVQEEEGYLSQDSLRLLSEKLSLPLSKLYHMATFYEALSLKPLGRYQFQVCTGTACHVRGASRVLDELNTELKINPGEVTPDLNFGLKTVNCVGACALGPVVVVEGKYYGNMSALKVKDLLKHYAKLAKAEQKN
ncbi:MAG: NAD(P)H-dependent oxidoreductase subunit E [Firmicutes bacterium]|jgi:NADH-quinone oxidoreductase subunit E|nr:NAD(P)H-dependent oxidoreductase subunit E [Bacillota bacterium]